MIDQILVIRNPDGSYDLRYWGKIEKNLSWNEVCKKIREMETDE